MEQLMKNTIYIPYNGIDDFDYSDSKRIIAQNQIR